MQFHSLFTIVAAPLLAAMTLPYANASPLHSIIEVLKAAAEIPSTWTRGQPSLPHANLTYHLHLKSPDDAGLDRRMHAAAMGHAEWLTVDELKQYVGTSDADLRKITSALQDAGIPHGDIVWSPLGNSVAVTSTVGQAAKLFSASFVDYTYHGQSTARPKARELKIPASLSPWVTGVSSLLDFPQRIDLSVDVAATASKDHGLRTRRRAPAGAPASCDTQQVTPQCRGDLYGTSGYKGKKDDDPGIGILAVGTAGFSNTDLQAYLQKFAPSAVGTRVKTVTYDGGVSLPERGGGEEALDIDAVVSTVAPIPTAFYISGNERGDFFASTFRYFIGAPSRPAVFTMSYGLRESSVSRQQAAAMCDYAKQLTALGTTLVVASGDDGVNDAHAGESRCPPFVPTYPSGCPYILSVGATSHFAPEVAVSEASDRYFGGSGFSNYFSMPEYQQKAAKAYLASNGKQATGQFNASGRGYPDVAAQGSRYATRLDGRDGVASGTSASAPAFASILTLVNSARKAAGKGLIGWVHPMLYQNSDAFNDITSGGSYGCGQNGGFSTSAGWDPSTGWGTPNFEKLRAAFGA